MSRHERTFRMSALCPDCDGEKRIGVGRRGPNDPDLVWIDCPTCDGGGELTSEPIEHEQEDA